MIFNNTVLNEFRGWLILLNYEPSTIKYSPQKVEELLYFLRIKKNICELEDIECKDINNFIKHLSNRDNKRTGKKLKSSYVRTYITAIKKFIVFLRKNKGITINFNLRFKVNHSSTNYFFTIGEIKKLYNATGIDAFGLRDRAILAIFYGCGLRRSEGEQLNVSDIDLTKRILHVRNAKNYKERYVPISVDVYYILHDYLKYNRSKIRNKKSNSFFITQNGNRVSGESLANRFRKIKQKAKVSSPGSLHSLRHSIATHLLKNEVDFDIIRKFLGHTSLQSTQIYIHFNK